METLKDKMEKVVEQLENCQTCGTFPAFTYHQNTRYEDPKLNIVTLCTTCRIKNDEYWEERWSEYYASL